MGVIATNKNQITFIYNSNNSLGKQAMAYVESSNLDVLAIDSAKTNVTSTQWVEIAKKINIEIVDLIDKEHPNFLKHHDKAIILDAKDWLKVIEMNPEVVGFSILILGEHYFKINAPSQITNHIDDYMAKRPRNARSN